MRPVEFWHSIKHVSYHRGSQHCVKLSDREDVLGAFDPGVVAVSLIGSTPTGGSVNRASGIWTVGATHQYFPGRGTTTVVAMDFDSEYTTLKSCAIFGEGMGLACQR